MIDIFLSTGTPPRCMGKSAFTVDDIVSLQQRLEHLQSVYWCNVLRERGRNHFKGRELWDVEYEAIFRPYVAGLIVYPGALEELGARLDMPLARGEECYVHVRSRPVPYQYSAILQRDDQDANACYSALAEGII